MKPSITGLVRATIRSLTQPSLIPFYGLNVLYGISQSDIDLGFEVGPISTIVLKTAPIWFLVFYVQVVKEHPISRQQERRRSSVSYILHIDLDGEDTTSYKTVYRECIKTGLFLSLCGDALLVFPSTFLLGGIFFAAAHLFYIKGLRRRYGKVCYAWLVFPITFLGSPYILSAVDSYTLALVIFMYNLTIDVMVFYAIASFESSPHHSTAMGSIGALSFIVSDTLIGINEWVAPLAHPKLYIMSLYYFAQLNLALSVF